MTMAKQFLILLGIPSFIFSINLFAMELPLGGRRPLTAVGYAESCTASLRAKNRQAYIQAVERAKKPPRNLLRESLQAQKYFLSKPIFSRNGRALERPAYAMLMRGFVKYIRESGLMLDALDIFSQDKAVECFFHELERVVTSIEFFLEQKDREFLQDYLGKDYFLGNFFSEVVVFPKELRNFTQYELDIFFIFLEKYTCGNHVTINLENGYRQEYFDTDKKLHVNCSCIEYLKFPFTADNRFFHEFDNLEIKAPRLKGLDLNGRGPLTTLLFEGRMLEYIDLSGTRLPFEQLLSISKNNPNLSHINFSYCGSIDLESIAKLFSRGRALKYLNLKGCSFTWGGNDASFVDVKACKDAYQSVLPKDFILLLDD